MRADEFQTRWSSPKQLLQGYMSGYSSMRRDSTGQQSQPRIGKPSVRIAAEHEDTGQRRHQPELLRKENAHTLSDQTRIISAFKNELSSLKSDVTRLISTNRDFTAAHNNLTAGCEPVLKEVRRPEGYETPRGFSTSQNSTILKRPAENNGVLHDQATMQKIPLGRVETANDSTCEDIRSSTVREKKLVEERDELAKKLQERNRQLDLLKNFNTGNKTDRVRVSLPTPRQQPERHYELVIEGLRRQNTELQIYYKQRLEEAEHDRKTFEQSVGEKSRELDGLHGQLHHLSEIIRQHEEMNYPRLLGNMQDANRALQRENNELGGKLRSIDSRCAQQEEKISRLEQMKRLIEQEKGRLFEDIYRLQEILRQSSDEVQHLKEAIEHIRRDKDYAIQQLTHQRDALLKTKEDYDARTREELEKNRPSKSQMTKSSIVQMGASSTSQNNLLEQAKKQEIEKLNGKIEQLKRGKHTLQRQVKALIDTKETIEQSIRNMPPNRTMDELKNELAQKDQALAVMHSTARQLQEEKEASERLLQRVKINEQLLRDANEAIMKRELGLLNKNYK